jgi:chemotaxis protein methyltransferase CheR
LPGGDPTIAPAAVAALGAAAGLDLPSYRPDHVARQVARACRREHMADGEQLAALLRANPEAVMRFRRAIAVSVTGLFRDPEQFELLEREVIPQLVADRRRLRVWSAGCANGTELYSIALLLERIGALDGAFLLGSDVLEENVLAARRSPPPGVDVAVRRHLRFEVRDLLREPPPGGRFGLILCRNVAIYFDRDAKRRVYDSLAGALAPGGVLVLGRSERLDAPAALGVRPIGAHAYVRDR